MQIPWALSATSIAYNVDGIAHGLKMTGVVLANIYLGNIKTWDDPKDQEAEPLCQPSVHRHHTGVPVRRQWDDLQLH